MNLGEIAGILAVLGTLIGGLVTYFTWHGNVNTKTQEQRVSDLQEAQEEQVKTLREQMESLRSDFKWQREDLTRQISDLKAQMVQQEGTIRRQDHMMADYVRHVGKLERIMAAANLPIPEFETTQVYGGMS